MELTLKEVDCKFMFDILLQYFLNYGLVSSFPLTTTDKNIVKVPDTSFYGCEDRIHHFLK